MDSKKIIEALKTNKVPFGLMSEEMQVKAREIKGNNWLKFGYNNRKWGEIEVEVDYGDFEDTSTYRLSSDYQPEPDIVECEVHKHTGCLAFELEDEEYKLHEACTITDFIGFKYEDGYTRPFSRAYKDKDKPGLVFLVIKTESLSTYEVLTPTHVLFKK